MKIDIPLEALDVEGQVPETGEPIEFTVRGIAGSPGKESVPAEVEAINGIPIKPVKEPEEEPRDEEAEKLREKAMAEDELNDY